MSEKVANMTTDEIIETLARISTITVKLTQLCTLFDIRLNELEKRAHRLEKPIGKCGACHGTGVLEDMFGKKGRCNYCQGTGTSE